MLTPSKPLAFLARCLAIAAAAALSVSCIRVQQTLTLNGDGSGTLALRYGMALENIQQMETMSRQAAEAEGETNAIGENPFDFDEADVREDFEQYKDLGVTLESIHSEVVDGWRYLSLRLHFASLQGLSKTEFMSDRGMTLIRRDDGNYAFRQAAPPVEQGAEQEGVSEMMAGVMKGFHATVTVVAPAPVLESNADRTEGGQVTWDFDLEKDPKALQRAQRMDMRVVFDGQGLDLPEFKGREGP